MGDGRYGNEFDYERSESDYLDQPHSGSRYLPADVYNERRHPPLHTGPITKKRPTADDYFENRSPSLKKKAGWNQWTAPAIKEREKPVIKPIKREESNRPQEFKQYNGNRKQSYHGEKPHSLHDSSVTPLRNSSPPVHPDRLRFLQQEPEVIKAEDIPEASSASPVSTNGPGFLAHRPQSALGEDISMRGDSHHFPMSAGDAPRRSFSYDRSNVPYESTDPRLPSRKDSYTQPASAGSAIPQSAYMDTSVSSPGNLPSGGHTPIKRPQTAFAIPPPPPPPPLIGTHVRSKESSSRDTTHVIQYLLQFGQNSAQEASLTMQYDAAITKLEKKKIEHDRWRSHHDSFKSLAEEQEKEIEKSQVATERLADRRKRHEEARNKTIQALASTLFTISNGSSISQPETESKMIQLEGEMRDVSAEVHGMQAALKDLSLEEGQLKALTSRQYQLNSQVNDLKDSTVSRESYTNLESRVANLVIESEAQNANNKYAELRDQVNKMETDFTSLNTLFSEGNESKEKLRDLTEEFQKLKSDITGDGQDDPGLIDFIMRHEDGIKRHEGALSRLQEAINGVGGEIDDIINKNTNHNTRIVSLESNSDRIVMKEKDSALPLDISGDAQDIPKTNTELTRDLKLLRQEQGQQDEIFSQEFEQIRGAISKTTEDIEPVRKEIYNLIGRVDSISAKLTQLLPPPPGSNETSTQRNPNTSHSGSMSTLPSQTPLIPVWAGRGTAEESSQPVMPNHIQLFEQLFHRMALCETSINDVQRRMNDLTYDKLASNVIYRMQQVFPSASNTQIQMQTLREFSWKFSQDITQLSAKVDSLGRQVALVDSRSLQGQKLELISKKEKQDDEKAALQTLKGNLMEMALESKKKIEAFDSRIGLLISDSEAHMNAYNSLNTKFDSTKSEVNEAVEALKSETGTIQVRLTEYEETALKEISKLSAKVELLNEQTGMESPSRQETAASACGVNDETMLKTPPLTDVTEDAREESVQPEKVSIQQRLFKKPKRTKDRSTTPSTVKNRKEE